MISVWKELQLEGGEEQSCRVPGKTLGTQTLGSAAGNQAVSEEAFCWRGGEMGKFSLHHSSD